MLSNQVAGFSVPRWGSDSPSPAQGSIKVLWEKAPLAPLSGPYLFSAGSSHMPHLFFQETLGPGPTGTAHLAVCSSASRNGCPRIPALRPGHLAPGLSGGRSGRPCAGSLPNPSGAQKNPVPPLVAS